ncbi:MAG: 2OG-Fe(II) oxygenase [Bacteroidota bacterium]|nr:2OG-Fe(II) oxygenase [Bacteroidota bacterium]
MDLINKTHTTPEARKELYNQFNNATPYKHLVIDNFLTPELAEQMFVKFPAYELFNKKYDGMNEKKAEGSNFQDFDPVFTDFKKFVSSPEFCEWITDVTGIKDVFVTDDALGTGLHQGGTGSFLDVHVDFSMHHLLNVYRRLNLLVFFNKGWQEDYKGHTELWNADMTKLEKKVLPIFNRAVMFETTGTSYHGYGKINPPEGVTRKSFYTYFYTKENDGAHKEGYHDTIFKARPEEGITKKVVTDVKESAKNFVKRTLKRLGVSF